MKSERQLAPWLSQPAIHTVGRLTGRRSGRRDPDRKRRMHRDARREQLLEACLLAFTGRGLEMTTMDTIAAQAGVSKPLVYRHFHNRYEALLAVVEQQSQRLLESMALAEADSNLPSFEFLLDQFLRFASDSPAGFRLLFQLVDANPGAARRRLELLREQLGKALMAALLQAAAGSGLGADRDRAEWMGELIVSILEGVAGGLAKGEDLSQRSVALRRLLRSDWVISSLMDVRDQPRALGTGADRGDGGK
ncbi:MAG TPA: TetR/AcrR family transcriptional regulator [Candidatus Nanopelagicaceae bacterium]|nr:TetR/AcrR family transcriptional regulator [Candidatus Nanopelagicaceae bacterium]